MHLGQLRVLRILHQRLGVSENRVDHPQDGGLARATALGVVVDHRAVLRRQIHQDTAKPCQHTERMQVEPWVLVGSSNALPLFQGTLGGEPRHVLLQIPSHRCVDHTLLGVLPITHDERIVLRPTETTVHFFCLIPML